jgi:hypothetical protein
MRKISSSPRASIRSMAPSFQMPAEWTIWSSPPSSRADSPTSLTAPASPERSAPTAKARPGNRLTSASASSLWDL